jgi:hypothetical protein
VLSAILSITQPPGGIRFAAGKTANIAAKATDNVAVTTMEVLSQQRQPHVLEGRRFAELRSERVPRMPRARAMALNGSLDNGILAGSVTAGQSNSSTDVTIGQNAGGATFEFSGAIDEVRIYSSALSPAQVQTDMNSAIATPNP